MLQFSTRFRFRRVRSTIRLLSSSPQEQPATLPESHTQPLSEAPTPIHIYVDGDIRRYLGMRNHERKMRVMVKRLPGRVTAEAEEQLRDIVEERLPALMSQPYALRFQVHGPGDMASGVVQSLQVFVEPKHGYPPLAHTPDTAYLDGMPDPHASSHMTLLSFYLFQELQNPQEVIAEMRRLWKPFRAVGRVYVAAEGINAQMAVPSDVLSQFRQACDQISAFSKASPAVFINVDSEVTRAVFDEEPYFRRLVIKLRNQVVTDSLQTPLDWSQAGREVPPREWHEAIDRPKAIVLDCRNRYETDVGRFEGAIPINTQYFRESWESLETLLKDVPRDTELLTYCTGGIRCVKINAYLSQRMNFSNIGRLHGGILNYARTVRESCIVSTGKSSDSNNNSPLQQTTGDAASGMQSKFQGINYVFDQRLGTRVTDDVLGKCHLCSSVCDTHTNCKAPKCRVRIVQCAKCAIAFSGCCSLECQSSLTLVKQSQQVKSTQARSIHTSAFASASASASATIQPQMATELCDTMMLSETFHFDSGSPVHIDNDALVAYCEKHSDAEQPLLVQLAQETAVKYADRPGAARMSSGHMQGRVLAMLASLSSASSVLELGSFTGYSALCFAYAIKDRALARMTRGEKAGVLTCETDSEAADIAQRYFVRFNNDSSEQFPVVDFQQGIRAADVIEDARRQGRMFDMVFIDADKKAYKSYLQNLLGESEEGASASCLLADGALIVVDNVLWKGMVPNCTEGKTVPLPPTLESTGISASHKRYRRQHVLAHTMHDFNTFVHKHSKLSTVILPIRDGLSCIRYQAKK